MARARLVFLVGVLLLSAGCGDSCAVSLHPFYAKDGLVEIPEAVGTWTNSEGARCVVSAPREQGYPVVCHDEVPESTEASRLVARFLTVDDQLFVDLFPDPDSAEETVGQLFVVPVHLLARVQVSDGVAQLAYLSGNWIESLAAKTPGAGAVRYEKLEEGYAGNILLTGKTDELRSLLRRAMAEEAAFSSLDEYRRVPD